MHQQLGKPRWARRDRRTHRDQRSVAVVRQYRRAAAACRAAGASPGRPHAGGRRKPSTSWPSASRCPTTRWPPRARPRRFSNWTEVASSSATPAAAVWSGCRSPIRCCSTVAAHRLSAARRRALAPAFALRAGRPCRPAAPCDLAGRGRRPPGRRSIGAGFQVAHRPRPVRGRPVRRARPSVRRRAVRRGHPCRRTGGTRHGRSCAELAAHRSNPDPARG